MDSAFKKHGQVFTVPLFHKRVTFLLGPEVSTHFYKVCLPYSRSNAERGRQDGTARRAGPRQLRALGSELHAQRHTRALSFFSFVHGHGRRKHALRCCLALSHTRQLGPSAGFAFPLCARSLGALSF
jgi:hypothetical protein